MWYVKNQTAVRKWTVVCRFVKPCGLVGRYQRTGGTYCLHLQGVTTQSINIEIFIMLRTSYALQ
jgi:hypothetical protein